MIEIKFSGSMDEIMRDIESFMAASPDTASAPAPQPVAHSLEPAPAAQTGRIEGPASVADLIAGMKLQPTQSSSLGDGSRVVNGDYVMCNGEVWCVDQTYRGSIVAHNEAGKADVLSAKDCAPAGQRQQESTAAPAAQESAPTIDTVTAQQYTDSLTAAVASNIIQVEDVFAALEQFGAKKVLDLTAESFEKFKAEMDAKMSPGAAPQAQTFGF